MPHSFVCGSLLRRSTQEMMQELNWWATCWSCSHTTQRWDAEESIGPQQGFVKTSGGNSSLVYWVNLVKDFKEEYRLWIWLKILKRNIALFRLFLLKVFKEKYCLNLVKDVKEEYGLNWLKILRGILSFLFLLKVFKEEYRMNLVKDIKEEVKVLSHVGICIEFW